MRMNFLKTAIAAIALVSASAASAATFDFTMFTGPSSAASKTYTSGVASVTASAGSTVLSHSGLTLKEATSPGATSANPGYYRGLGATSTQSANGALNAGEFVEFVIPSGYMVTSVTATLSGTGSQALEMFMDSTFVGSGTITALNNSSTDGRTSFSPVTGSMGSSFVVHSSQSNSGGIWINSIELAQVVTTPLPAGAVLLGGALLGGAAAARRKARKA